MKRSMALLCLCGLTLNGCGAGIKVSAYGTKGAKLGVPYNLPMTTFKITLVRTITQCGDKVGGNVTATVETDKKIDPEARYTLSSDGFWSTTDIKGQYATDGTTTGLNTSSEGQAGAAISDIITTVATIAPLVAAAAGASGKELCTAKVVAAVAAVSGGPDKKANPGLKDIVDTETSKLTDLTNNLTVLTAQVSAMGAAIDAANQTKFWKAVQAVFDLKTKLADDQGKLNEALKNIQDTQVVYWPLHARDNTESIIFDRTKLAKWVDTSQLGRTAERFDVFLTLERKDDGTFTAAQIGANPKPETIKPKYGVPIRFPTAGVLHICSFEACGSKDANKVSDTEAGILQFGHVYMVPVAGNAFTSTTAAIAYDASGNPTSIEIGNKTAIITTATSTAKSVATSVAGIPQAISSAKLNQTKAETDQINADVALASARAGSEQAIQTASAKVQTDLLSAKAALAKAQADGMSGSELLTLQSQTALLNAQQAQLSAQQALDAATKASGK